MPRLHPREKMVREAQTQLMQNLLDLQRNFELTDGEWVSIIAGELGDTLTRWAKYAIREERHGRADRPGGLAGPEDEDGER